SRLHSELPDYIEILNESIIGQPITRQQYGARKWDDQPTNKYVMCSLDDARSILQAGPPRLPIFIPAELNPDQKRLNIPDYLDFLRTRDNIDVHVYDDPAGEISHPRSMKTGEALELFATSKGPINFLNLAGYKSNPDLLCFEGIPAYSILRDIKSDLQSGKKSKRLVSDLSECVSFQLCATKGAFSLPHIDQHGVITTVFCDDGLKLWHTWAGLGIDNILQYAQSDCLPTSSCIAFLLYPGCSLIMPSGTLHAVGSRTNVLMSGTMHWDSRDMLRTAKLTQFAIKFPYLSNEDVAEEYPRKMEKVADFWTKDVPVWPWAPKSQLPEFKNILE
ncbi:hypothetical protein B0T24DRAFT_499586, partial [Lasiosphaeria ovina]